MKKQVHWKKRLIHLNKTLSGLKWNLIMLKVCSPKQIVIQRWQLLRRPKWKLSIRSKERSMIFGKNSMHWTDNLRKLIRLKLKLVMMKPNWPKPQLIELNSLLMRRKFKKKLQANKVLSINWWKQNGREKKLSTSNSNRETWRIKRIMPWEDREILPLKPKTCKPSLMTQKPHQKIKNGLFRELMKLLRKLAGQKRNNLMPRTEWKNSLLNKLESKKSKNLLKKKL